MGSSGSKERPTENFKKTASTSVMPTIVEEADGTIIEEEEEEELFYSYKVDSFSAALSHNSKYNMQITGGQKNRIVGMQVNNLTYVKSNRKLSLKEAERYESIRKSLKIFYSCEEAWLIPLQWLPNTRLEPEQYFVDLELEELSRGGNFIKKNQTALDEMLVPEQGSNAAPKRILVRGEAGFGKSTLCTKIAYDWAIERRGGIASKFELAIMYRLRDLEENSNLEEQLIEFCQKHCLTKNKPELTSETLTVKAERIFLILDGYDEATEEQRMMVNDILGLNQADYQSVFRASTILVTSRPTENPSFLRLFQRHVRITGLSETSRKNLISKLMKYDSIKSRRVEENLNAFDYLFLRDLSPFLLYLICYLHAEKGEDQELNTPFKLLESVTNFLAKRCSEREQLYMKEEEIQETLHTLGEFFFDKLKSSKMMYQKSELRKFFQSDKRLRLVEKCGILKTPATFKKETADTLEPIHKLFVEYLSTFYLNNFFKKKCATPEEKLKFLSNVTKKFGGKFHFYSPSSSEMYLVVETWVDGIEFLLSVNFMEKDKLKCLSNGDFLFTSDPRARKITSGISEHSWNSASVRMDFRKMEEDSGFPGAKTIIPYWIRGREFAASVLEKMIHQDYVVVLFWQDNFKIDETRETSMEFDFSEDENILWSCVLKLSTLFNPETTTNVDPTGTLVFKKLTLTMRMTDLPKDYLWCKRFTSFTLRCSRDMPAIDDKVKSGQFLHALISSLESCKQYKWTRFDITPKNFDRAFAIDCLVKRGRVKLNLLEGKPINEIIRVSRFMERKESFIQKLNFDFYEDDRQVLFIVVKN